MPLRILQAMVLSGNSLIKVHRMQKQQATR